MTVRPVAWYTVAPRAASRVDVVLVSNAQTAAAVRPIVDAMDDRAFVLVKGRAGLGDRIISALGGILYARLTNRRLFIDWRDTTYSDDGSNVFHRYFVCSSCGPDDEIPPADSISPIARRDRLEESAPTMGVHTGRHGASSRPDSTSKQERQLGGGHDGVVSWFDLSDIRSMIQHLDGPTRKALGGRITPIVRRALRDDLLLHPDIRQRVDRFKSKHFKQRTVGVHVRYSDHRTSLGAVFKQVDALLRREPDLQIFLATDNPDVKRAFDEGYPAVISTPHWYPPSGFPAHGHAASPSRKEHGIEALVDLYLLAECEYLIIDTSSSFSRVARWLTTAPRSNVFDVRGRKVPKRFRRRIWHLWLRLGLFRWGPNVLRRWARMRQLGE